MNCLLVATQLLACLELSRTLLAHLVAFVCVPIPHVQVKRLRCPELPAADRTDVHLLFSAMHHFGMDPEVR